MASAGTAPPGEGEERMGPPRPTPQRPQLCPGSSTDVWGPAHAESACISSLGQDISPPATNRVNKHNMPFEN